MCLLVVFFSCNRDKFNYIAECSYCVNGELITSNGGGVGCFISYGLEDTLANYNTLTSIFHNGVNSVVEDKDNRIAFLLLDWTGDASQRYFDVQNLSNNEYLKLFYNGKEYQAISGYVNLEITGNFINSSNPYKEEVAFRGTFEAVMVNAKDTVYVTSGSCYYSWMRYGELR